MTRTKKQQEDFENFLCAVAWLKQYCARTDCRECVIWSKEVPWGPEDMGACPICEVSNVPATWNIDGKTEIFQDLTDEIETILVLPDEYSRCY